MTKVAIIPAPGIGDGLIMHIFAHALVQMECEVTTFHAQLSGFGKWLPGFQFAAPDKLEDALKSFDAIILQHDNSPRCFRIGVLNPFTFFGSHQPLKHGPLRETDFVCDPSRTMVDNVASAMEKWFGASSKENGLVPPADLVHRKYPHRVAIHPASSDPKKNWPHEKFVRMAQWLRRRGYDPLFLADEKGAPQCRTLEDLASSIYESGYFLGNDSGPGHLASYLQIPSLIIGRDARQMRLWRPGWTPPRVLTPPLWTSSWKWTQDKWALFIPVKTAIKEFVQLSEIK